MNVETQEIKNPPFVSIIINCYNSERFLSETLDSVFAQTFNNYEVIVWDNQSTDKTADIVNSFSGDKIRYFYAKKHTLLGEARYLALQKARAEWVAFLDSDDLWHPSKLERQVELIRDKPDVAFTYCRSEIFKDKGDYFEVRTQNRGRELPEGDILKDLIRKNHVYLLSALINRDKLIEISAGIKEYKQAEDYYIFLKLSEKYKVSVLQETYVKYRIHENNLTGRQLDDGVIESLRLVNNYKLLHEEEVAKSTERIRCLSGGVNFFSCLLLAFEERVGLYFNLFRRKVKKIKKRRAKVLFLLPTDERSGAENIMNAVSNSLDNSVFDKKNVIMKGCDCDGCHRYDYSLDISGLAGIGGAFRYYLYLKKINPDVIVSSIYYADFLSSLVGKLAGIDSVIWVLHNGVEYSDLTLKQKVFFNLLALMSNIQQNSIITCSETIKKSHEERGYDGSIIKKVSNGVDTRKYMFRSRSRGDYQQKLSLCDENIVIGYSSRFHELKGHRDLLQFFGVVKSKGYNAKLVLCGRGVDYDNAELNSQIQELGIEDDVFLLGERKDIDKILSVLDIYVSTSYAEAFPVSILEAMSVGLPVIAYDTGDIEMIVGDTGWVVENRNINMLVSAFCSFMSEENDLKIKRKKLARKRVMDHFSIELMNQEYFYHLKYSCYI